ncbi:MAG: oligopeptide/dipeptide ABC transporter ATP-binding protein [Candidatus Omnitrophota bacterium]
MSEVLFELSGIKKYYYIAKNFFSKEKIEVKAVDEVSFFLKPATTLAIVGESGCGKTTLAKIILKLIVASSGIVRFGSQISDLRKDIQLVFQNPYQSLNPLMRIKDILNEPLLIHNVAKNRENRIKELLELVGIDPNNRFRFPSEFSGGQRQRISIARALATEPKLIILDEPVSSLDVKTQLQILNLLKDLQKRLNLSYLLITHNLSIVKNFSDYLLVMYLGKILEKAPPGDIFNKPIHPYSESLILSAIEKRSKLKGEIPRFKEIYGCIFNTRCPYSQNKCFKIRPELEELCPSHFAACHFPLNLKRS